MCGGLERGGLCGVSVHGRAPHCKLFHTLTCGPELSQGGGHPMLLLIHVYEGGALLACNQEAWRGWRSAQRVLPHGSSGLTVQLPGGSHATGPTGRLATHPAAPRTPQDLLSRVVHALGGWPAHAAAFPGWWGAVLPLLAAGLLGQRCSLANLHWLLLAAAIYIAYSRALSLAQVDAKPSFRPCENPADALWRTLPRAVVVMGG